MFLGMMGNGGVGKNVDAVAAKIAQIEASLKSIDRLLGNIGKKSGNLNIGGGGSGVGTGSGLGMGAPLFNGQSGNIPVAPTFSQMFSAKFPRVSGGLAIGMAVGSGLYNAIPGVPEAMDQRQAMFSATLGTKGMPNYTGLKTNMMTAFGGYASSNSSQENVAALMANYGMSGTGGVAGRFMNQTSAMSLLGGMTQEQAAQMGMGLATPQTSNNLMMLGISSINRDGSPKDFGAVVNQIAKRTFGGNFTMDQLNKSIGPSGHLRQMLTTYLGGSDQADLAIKYLRAQAANGGSANLSTKQLESWGLTDASRNPNARQQQYEGIRSKTVADYSDKLLQGWDKALGAAETLERVLQDMKDVLGPMAQSKGFLQGFSNTAAGAATLGMGTLLGQVGGNILTRRMLGGGNLPGSNLLSNAMASGRGPGATGWGTALGRAGGFGLAAAGAAWAQGKLSEWGDQHGVGADTGIGQFGRVAASAGTGALAGAAIGSIVPGIGTAIGAAVGGVIGGGIGLFTNNIGDSGSSMGSPGGGGPAGSATTQKGGKNVNRGGAAGAVAWAIGQVTKPDKNYRNLCDHFVGRAYGRAHSGYSTAWEHWQSIPAKLKHSDGNPPPGALVFWFTGKGRAGHVALSVGGGKVASNDIRRSGKIDIVPIGEITTKWHAKYLGWTPPYFGGKSVSNLGPAGAVSAAAAAAPTGGATAATSNYASSEAGTGPQGFATVSSVGASISASAYGGLSAGQYSIAGMVSTTTGGLMAGSGVGVGTSLGATQAANSRTRTPGDGPTSGANLLTGSQQVAAGSGNAYTRDSWAAAFLARLGIKQTSANVKAVSTWERYEGGHWNNRARFNPLNTTQIMDGNDPSINSHGVKAYSDWSEGLTASVNTLRNGRYGNILKALAGGSEKDIYSAITSSPWGTKNLPHYSQGSWRIEKDQIAKIHQGEMILPASVAEAVRNGVRSSFAGQGGGSGGSKHIVIEFNATGHTESDARAVAMRVKEILEEDDMLSTIGGS